LQEQGIGFTISGSMFPQLPFFKTPMNTRLRLLTVLSLAVLASACGKDDDKTTATPAAPEVSLSPQAAPETETETETDSKVASVITPFDINDFPVTNKDIGEFPFFMPPKGYRYVTRTKSILDEDISLQESARAIYPLGIDRIRMVEGKTFKASLYNEKQKGVSERDFLLILRHYEDAITEAGGVQVFGEKVEIGKTHGTLAPEERQSLPYSTRSPRRVFVIHTPDAEVWLEIYCGGGAGCLFNVTQKGKM
jgi:hypothetical protein